MMKAPFVATAFLLVAIPAFAGDAPLDYPETARGPDVDIMHGVEVADPYRWLENMDDQATLDWAAAQTKVARYYLAGPGREEIRERMAELSNLESYPAAAYAGGRSFVTRAKVGTRGGDILVKDHPDGDFRTLWRAADHAENGRIYPVRNLWPSPDGTKLAYTVSPGSAWWQANVIDVESGDALPGIMPALHSLNGTLTWSPDGQGFYYIGWERDGAADDIRAPATNGRVYYHRLGTDTEDDILLFDSLGSKWIYGVSITGDGRFLLVHAREGAVPNSRFFIKDLRLKDGAFVPWFTDREADYSFLGGNDSRLFFYTDFDAKNGRIIAIDRSGPSDQQYSEIIGETEHAMFAGSLVGGNAIGLFAERFVLTYSEHGTSVVKVFDLDGAYQFTLDLPVGSTIWGGFSGTAGDPNITLRTLNPFSAGQVHRFDVHTGELETVAEPKGGLDRRDYTTEQVFYESEDGTTVPMTLSYKKGMKRDGANPVFMYGYGAYGWVAFNFYQPHMAYWMEIGGIYATPGIRGGGEYGPEWREAGRAENKTNTVADYIAAAKWLIDENYTRPELMIANGGSASGFLPAIAMIKEPKLFAGAVIDIPILDLMRLEKFGNGSFVKAEYGSPEDAEEFATLHKLSPYHALKEGACYPPTIVMVGEKDTSAVPAHGYKFVAALQHADGCGNPALLNVMPGARHNYGTTTEQNIHSRVDQILFSLRTIGRNPADPQQASKR